MPIRTHRGRAAVYRRFWSAPMRSPKHLVGTVVVIVGLLTAIGFLLPNVVSTGDGRMTSGTETTTWSADGDTAWDEPTETETRLPSSPLTPSSAPPSPQAVSVAGKWAKAWVDHPKGKTEKEWLAGLEPYTQEEYLSVLETVEIDNIPAKRVTGKPEPKDSYTSSVEVSVPTDGPTLLITVVETDDGWRVTKYGMEE